jgi:hypothetical protein
LFPEIVFNFINCNSHEEGHSEKDRFFLKRKRDDNSEFAEDPLPLLEYENCNRAMMKDNQMNMLLFNVMALGFRYLAISAIQ